MSVTGGDAAAESGARPEAPRAAVGALPKIDHAARVERAREAADAARASGLAVTAGANLRYLTGLSVEPSERLVLLVVPARGEVVLLGPAFERDRLAGVSGAVAG